MIIWGADYSAMDQRSSDAELARLVVLLGKAEDEAQRAEKIARDATLRIAELDAHVGRLEGERALMRSQLSAMQAQVEEQRRRRSGSRLDCEWLIPSASAEIGSKTPPDSQACHRAPDSNLSC